MPSLRDIRNRITSVRSTRQITRAMKMVSAAKLRRAQDAILRTRPYAQLLDQMLARVAAARSARRTHRTRSSRRGSRTRPRWW